MALSVGTLPPKVLISLCLNIITAVLVGEAQSWLPELIERTKKLSVNGGFEQGADLCVYSHITGNHVVIIFL